MVVDNAPGRWYLITMMEIRTQTQAGTVAEGAAAPPAYEVHRYAADGHADAADEPVHLADDIDGAREWIADRIDLDLDDARWHGTSSDIEAYHESSREGCGGYAIRRAEDV